MSEAWIDTEHVTREKISWRFDGFGQRIARERLSCDAKQSLKAMIGDDR